MNVDLKDIKSVDRNRVKAFFAFDLMVLPWLVKILFVLGLIGIFLGGIAMPFRVASGISWGPSGVHSEFNCGTFALASVFSVIFMVIGMVWWRVVCESMIVLFKIREDLAVLRGPLAPPAPATIPAEAAKTEPPKPDAPSPSEAPKA